MSYKHLKDDLTIFDTSTGKRVFRLDVTDGKAVAHDEIFFEGQTNMQNTVVNGNIFIYSDDRVKTGEYGIMDATKTLCKLRAVQYEKYSYNIDAELAAGNAPNKSMYMGTQSGFIAQEIMKNVPELDHVVLKPKNAEVDYYSVDYMGMVAYLVKSVQELNARINELESDKVLNF